MALGTGCGCFFGLILLVERLVAAPAILVQRFRMAKAAVRKAEEAKRAEQAGAA